LLQESPSEKLQMLEEDENAGLWVT
jgi:hypothetical protein